MDEQRKHHDNQNDVQELGTKKRRKTNGQPKVDQQQQRNPSCQQRCVIPVLSRIRHAVRTAKWQNDVDQEKRQRQAAAEEKTQDCKGRIQIKKEDADLQGLRLRPIKQLELSHDSSVTHLYG